jgi:hypothetical protein
LPTSGHAGIKPGVYTECAQNPVISEVVQKAKRTGTSRSGAVYEQLMRVREPDSGETLLLRRITVKLKVATRDGVR